MVAVSEPVLNYERRRLTILDRDGYTCQNCGTDVVSGRYDDGETAHVHHIEEKSEGGEDVPSNLVTLCEGCHIKRHRQTPIELPDFDLEGEDWLHESVLMTESMARLLDWFAEQPCSCATVGHIADEIDYSRETIRGNLKQLAAAENAELRHAATASYRLIDDPRQEAGDG